MDTNKLAVVRTVLKHCGGERRVMDLFSDRTISSRFATLAKQHLKVRQAARGSEKSGVREWCGIVWMCGRVRVLWPNLLLHAS